MFGGVNASVPTPFGADTRVDLDAMAAHCFWLMANGCNGLVILDGAGEVAALAVRERIEIVAGLISRGVPASKMLVGIGPASAVDGVRIAERAAQLGVRGVMLRASVNRAVSPSDVLSKDVRALLHSVDPTLHLYLSLSVSSSAIASCLTALEACIAQVPQRLRGIRDETHGCRLGLAALERFKGGRFEVYTADDAMLAEVVLRGGAGLISPAANFLGRLCGAVMQTITADQDTHVQRAIAATCEVLRSRPAVVAVKALLARHTGRPTWNTVRLPLRPLGSAERDVLFRAFDATGIRLQPAG